LKHDSHLQQGISGQGLDHRKSTFDRKFWFKNLLQQFNEVLKFLLIKVLYLWSRTFCFHEYSQKNTTSTFLHFTCSKPYFLLTFFTQSAIYVLPDSKKELFARYVLVFAKCVLTESSNIGLSLNHQKTGFYHNFSVLIQFSKKLKSPFSLTSIQLKGI
jgi:hypothetical protein